MDLLRALGGLCRTLRVGAGKIKSVHGGLDAPVVDAAFVFSFGVDRARRN